MPSERQLKSAYKVFVIVASPLLIPLIILVLRFSGDEKFGWISNISQAVLFLIGLIGGIAGWWRYGIQRHSPFEDLRRWLNRRSSPADRNNVEKEDSP
ncbi:MAG TPA: hypothetical protein VKM56_01775 [Verrucomicrobiae bacterium]|nr:hypothetical protein [Verrucomicrobiae bacterium]